MNNFNEMFPLAVMHTPSPSPLRPPPLSAPPANLPQYYRYWGRFARDISSSAVPTSVSTVSGSTLLNLAVYKVHPGISLLAFLFASNSSSDYQPFFLIALAWSHTRCSVDSDIPLSVHSLNILSVSHNRCSLLIKKLTFVKIILSVFFTSLFHFILAVARRRPDPRCCVREHLPGKGTSRVLVPFTPLFSKIWFNIFTLWGFREF